EKSEGMATFNNVGQVQLAFLRLLSDKATQNFTYHCTSGVAWYDQANNNYDSAITFLADNGDELSHGTAYQPTVIKDECQTRPTIGETVFEITTSKRSQLPIRDFAPVDFVQKKQKFAFEAGPVCFL
ncbi:hypothetical protein, partial [Salmonella sp. s51944]|uniref:hypothetical protein n=1 Tax=Salmonella sp. s51944 TaxID=3159655 RepID=UPI00397EF223